MFGHPLQLQGVQKVKKLIWGNTTRQHHRLYIDRQLTPYIPIHLSLRTRHRRIGKSYVWPVPVPEKNNNKRTNNTINFQGKHTCEVVSVSWFMMSYPATASCVMNSPGTSVISTSVWTTDGSILSLSGPHFAPYLTCNLQFMKQNRITLHTGQVAIPPGLWPCDKMLWL